MNIIKAKYNQSQNKKKFFCGLEPVNMYWDFYSIINAFQMILDTISNFIYYECCLIFCFHFVNIKYHWRFPKD